MSEQVHTFNVEVKAPSRTDAWALLQTLLLGPPGKIPAEGNPVRLLADWSLTEEQQAALKRLGEGWQLVTEEDSVRLWLSRGTTLERSLDIRYATFSALLNSGHISLLAQGPGITRWGATEKGRAVIEALRVAGGA